MKSILKSVSFTTQPRLLFFSASICLSACQPPQTPSTEIADTTNSQTLSIAAAANLADVLPRIIEGYCTDKGLTDCPIESTYASSGKLYAQIVAGAPYDLYLAANQSYPQKLVNEMADKRQHQQPFTYTQGQLVLYSSTQTINPNTDNLKLLNNANFKVAIANPELAPYGKAAQTYLAGLNVYEPLSTQKRLVMAENIGQAFQFTNTGHADLGFVALSQIKGLENKESKPVLNNYQIIPVTAYPAILQDGMLLTDNTLAADFASYLQSDKGQEYFAQAGYLPVQSH
ncbi:molybdate ABC transporter substrate-binding protein [Psychrobacter sp. I-STPA10]|uniref:molybdate ABC transporter substrate-binding protein n=1 Tax=Psychrobacter sp. I-STPA10 TaxID=2585769 RepID=UPI001E2E08F7|nr:molybdate ABC transporter substrate-binding protein [Psychrobacter sp. I-STPA10]